MAPNGADPWVIRHGGVYYYCYSQRGAVWVNASGRLEEAVQRNGRRVWKPEPGKPYSRGLWAPELHRLDGKWYIYVAATGGPPEDRRMWVLEGHSDDPQGEFILRGKMGDATDRWAIDGTVLEHRGARYFIWSGWEGGENVAQNLYIARMDSPTSITGPRVLISRPEHPWERRGNPKVNEGPTVLKQGNDVFVIYSASGSWTDHYCLGQLRLTGADPMEAASWRKKPTPVFKSANSVFGPGHASFVKSPDGKEDWIVYHAAKHSGAGWDRNIRMQPFQWNSSGEPNFGEPMAEGTVIPAPLGADGVAHGSHKSLPSSAPPR